MEANAATAEPTPAVAPKPTARGFSAALKKKLKELGFPTWKVSAKTWSFSGFGFGEACSATVYYEETLPDNVREALLKIEQGFCATPGGPQFSGNRKSSFKVDFRRVAAPTPTPAISA